MKRIVFLIAVLWGLIMVVSAQSLKVRPDGNIQAYTSGVYEDARDNSYKMLIRATNREGGLYVRRSGAKYTSNWTHALEVSNEALSGVFNCGLQISAQSGPVLNSGWGFGLYSIAGNTTTGHNFAVAGQLSGSQKGAAIYGSLGFPNYVPGRYAGYFEGNVKVTGTVNGITVTDSDIRYKKNVLVLKDKKESTLDMIGKLNPIEYNLKQVYAEVVSDTATIKVARYIEETDMFQKKHYGLIAQELQEIYPDLVYEGDNGYLSINYTGLIPILIQSIKELKTEVETQKGNKLIKASELQVTSYTDIAQEQQVKLYQNIPNPFNQETEIAYQIPQGANAFIGIYNLNGQQLKTYQLTETINGTITISASEFSAGIYIYSLVVNGQEVDSKRMVLTN